MDAWTAVFASILGVFVGAYLSWLISRRQRRIDRTFEMHREFHSIEMISARYSASEILAQHLERTYTDLRRDVWTVTQFYQRLWLAILYHGVHRAYVPALFGDVS